MTSEKAGPALWGVHPKGSSVISLTIHKADVTLIAVQETFNCREDYRTQAPKITDVGQRNFFDYLKKVKVEEKVGLKDTTRERDWLREKD